MIKKNYDISSYWSSLVLYFHICISKRTLISLSKKWNYTINAILLWKKKESILQKSNFKQLLGTH